MTDRPPAHSQDSWTRHFRAAAAEHQAGQRRLHAAAIGALLLHGALFTLRLPAHKLALSEPAPTQIFRLQHYRPRPRVVELPPPVTPVDTAPRVTQPTIIVPGPPEIDLVPTLSEPALHLAGLIPEIDLLAALPAAPPPMPAKPVPYDRSIERPERLFSPLPTYTAAARRARLEGRVLLEAVIDEHGVVTAARIVKGLGLGLDQSALATVSTWRFAPARRQGRPIAVIYNLMIHFRIH